MDKLRIWIAIVFVLFSFIPFSIALGETDPLQNYIVIFENNIDKSVIEDVQGQIVKEYTHFPALAIELRQSAIQKLESNRNIVSIEEDQPILINSTETKGWGIEKTMTPLAWNHRYTGKNVKVAVMDSGIDYTHPDLEVHGGISLVGSTYSDKNGHGTHVAGIIAAKHNGIGTVGVAPNVELYSIKVLDHNGAGSLSNVLAGFEWAIANQIDIINISLSVAQHSDILEHAVKEADKHGILLVAAAGNSGTPLGRNDSVEYPAKYDEVIAVAATRQNNHRANFSATGNTIELSAPGVDINSTYLNHSYKQMEGTSMAAPFVTGHLALLKEAYPCKSSEQLRTLLRENALHLGSSAHYGYGLVQASVKTSESTARECKRVSPNKTWTITFNQIVHKDTMDENIYVLNRSGEKHPVWLTLNHNGESIFVSPLLPYKLGETYDLYINHNVTSINGQTLTESVQMEFMIQN